MWPIAQQTLLCGGNVYVHCIAGRHRGATVAALMRSLLVAEPFADSVRYINGVRDVQIDKVLREAGVEAWVRDTHRMAPTGVMYPRPQGCIATARSNMYVDAGGGVPLCRHCQGEQQASNRLKNAFFVAALHEAQGYERPFCADCMHRAPTSWHPR